MLFNHESPRRGETFVTRKITMFFARKVKGFNEILKLETYMLKEIGATLKIMWKCNGELCNKKNQMIM